MSRLLNPGIGDICDRLTILELKLLHAPADRSVDHFLQERNGLLTKVRAATLNGSWFERVLGLAAVNARLWQLEDEIRGYRLDWAGGIVSKEALMEDATKCAFAIAEMNDRRAQLVREINELTGDQWIEKL